MAAAPLLPPVDLMIIRIPQERTVHVLRRLNNLTDCVLSIIGKSAAMLICVMIGFVLVEIIGRYFFGSPTYWVHDMSGWAQVFFIFLGGAFAFQKGYFVRVDIIYVHFTPKVQLIIDATVGTFLFACFAVVLIYLGSDFAFSSYQRGEISSTGNWEGPVYPAKFMVPLGMTLLTIAWCNELLRKFINLKDSESEK